MTRRPSLLVAVALATAIAAVSTSAFADSSNMRNVKTDPLSLSYVNQDSEVVETETTTETTEIVTVETTDTDYKGVDDFFNVREANSNVKACRWEFEITSAWMTYHSRKHRDDDVTLTPSIKYGITDDLFVELILLPVNFGDGLNLPDSDGADGTGDVALRAFWTFLRENDDWRPAMAISGDIRLPTGENSEKVDGTLNLHVTKTICRGLRAHLLGFIQTANGSRGDWNRDEFGDRRHFQWGFGPGLDYEINECNMLVLNYLNRSSDYYGHQNNNIFEVGWVYKINECSYLRAAVDAEVHADANGPHWTAKLQYSYSW